MQFRFPCLVVRHSSGRVTVTVIDHPTMAVHAESIEAAWLDLRLALDDRISRVHPRLVAGYATGAEGEAKRLDVPAVRVWYGEAHTTAEVPLVAWQRPAPGGLAEVHLPRLDLRFWVDPAVDVKESLGPSLAEVIKGLDDDRRLGLGLGGAASLETLEVESAPLRLSALRTEELRLEARPFRTREEQEELDAQADPARRRRQARSDERARRERERRRTPTLRSLAVALHSRAVRAQLEPAWEREADVDRLLAYVERERPQPLALVAPQGAGKTALLEALAARMGDPQGPKERRRRPVFALDASRLIAGHGGFGEWQQQLNDCLEEARRSGAVLLLGRLSELLDAGRSAHSDSNAAQVLAPALAAREVTVLAEATAEEWAVVQRRNASFASVWATWTLEELSPEATGRVLARVAGRLGERLSVAVQPGVVDAALGLCRRFWPYGALVGNAVTFVRRLMAARAHDRAPAVSANDAIAFFSSEAGIPLVLLRDDLELDPESVRAFLAERVMAQPRAVGRATQVVSTLKASLQDPRRPAAVLLFAGPTGVGKTELAKALAEYVFGSRERLIRVDMGEYLGPDALDRLLGGGDGAGLLPALVRRQPFCVLLLDELEKAHPVVFDALLGVLGEGRLTDAEGKVTDFRNAVIVMTTNLGADTLRARVGFGGGGEAGDEEAVRRHYVAEAQRFFRPEFFNRLDDLIVFRPLGEEAIRSIVRREVQALGQREGLVRRDLALDTTEASLDLLAREGLDPRLGARPLKRAIERRLAVPAATWLASHRQTGPTRLAVDVDEGRGGLRFRAESLQQDTAGSRSLAEQVLDEAADLRALVGRWDRSAAARALRSRHALVSHSLRSKGFWSDKSLAEDLAREDSLLRSILEPLEEMRRGAEAAEDLAVEAWYDRRADTIDTIREELAVLRRRFAPLPRRVYLARDPATTAALVHLTATRQNWGDLVGLFWLYRRWAEEHKLQVKAHLSEFIPVEERPGTKLDDPERAWRWVEREPFGANVPIPAVAALEVRGSADVNFLRLEDGGHRFADGSGSLVRVRFVPLDPRAGAKLRTVKEIQELMRAGDVRRYSRSKGKARDHRLDEDFEFTAHEGEVRLDLEAVHGRWIERSCLSEGELSWS